MRTESNTTQDIAPVITITAPWRIQAVEPIAGYRLRVKFMDATEGLVDLTHLITASSAGVFSQLQDQQQFEDVGVEYGAVTWRCGLDLAPDTMYQMILKNPEHVYVVGKH